MCAQCSVMMRSARRFLITPKMQSNLLDDVPDDVELGALTVLHLMTGRDSFGHDVSFGCA